MVRERWVVIPFFYFQDMGIGCSPLFWGSLRIVELWQSNTFHILIKLVHSPTRTLPGLNGHNGLNLLYMGLILVNKAFRLDIFHKFLVALYACECPKRFITARALTLCYTWQVSIKERISTFFVLYCMLLLSLETILNNPLYYFDPETSPKQNPTGYFRWFGKP